MEILGTFERISEDKPLFFGAGACSVMYGYLTAALNVFKFRAGFECVDKVPPS